MKAREPKGGAGLGGDVEYQTLSLGQYASAVEATLRRMTEEKFLARLWQKDPTLWKDDPPHQKVIRNALGWLTVAGAMLEQAEEIQAFAGQVRADGIADVVLLGMGGSSLCAEVFRRPFGRIGAYPRPWGLDVKGVLERAVKAADACGPGVPPDKNPAARLGAILGALAGQGRDKVTLVTPRPIDSLGLWVEQLVAESTGKEGRGILPVPGEPLGPPGVYGDDRVFVSIATPGGSDAETEAKLRALEAAGHPGVRHPRQGPLSLGAEFFVWEVATALVGALLRINPFDQPNVQESKDNTNRLLEVYRRQGKFPEQEILVEADGCRITRRA